MELPDSLKNIVMKQLIGSDSCDELTKNGKECGNRFIYSINEYLFSKEELKKVMVNCTKFCLKHLSDLAINGELLLGYEIKDDKRIIPLKKDYVAIEGKKDGKFRIIIIFNFPYEDSPAEITVEFDEILVDDMDTFRKTMTKDHIDIDKKGYPVMVGTSADFYGPVISESWKKFITKCFKKYVDEVELTMKGKIKMSDEPEFENNTLSLGNLDVITVTKKTYFRKILSVWGEKRIKL